jgi:DNA-binding MarR family transcriptional regulator
MPVDLYRSPGHLVRRVQQLSNAVFGDEIGDADLTPPQFALLVTLHHTPAADQIGLSRLVGIDRSTVADVVARLRDRGLVDRTRDPRDARRNTVSLTAEGRELVDRLTPGVLRAQERLLGPLSGAERTELLRLLTRIVVAHDPNYAGLVPPEALGPGPGYGSPTVRPITPKG